LELNDRRDVLLDKLFKQSLQMWAWDQKRQFHEVTVYMSKPVEQIRQHRNSATWAGQKQLDFRH
jgi:hypothetical protein